MKETSAIVWDLDKTLYPFDDAFCAASKKALVRMIRDLEVGGLSPQEASAYAESTYPMKTISKLRQDFGRSTGEMFSRYYDCLDEKFLKPSAGFLQEARVANVPFGVLSHCTRDWADRALAQLGISDFIDPNHIVTIEDLDGISKDEGPEPFQEILGRMGLPADRGVMVEDKDKNLKYARAMGMKTVLVTNGDETSATEHADHIYPTGYDFLREFNQRAQKPASAFPSRPFIPVVAPC